MIHIPQTGFKRDVMMLGVLAAAFAASCYGLLALVGTPTSERLQSSSAAAVHHVMQRYALSSLQTTAGVACFGSE